LTLGPQHSILGGVTTPDVPLVRIQLRYPDEGIFIQRFAPNVTRGGIFLASRSPQPVGTVIDFEVALVQGPPLLFGTGKVAWVREFDPQEPQRAHGMGVQFMHVAESCRPMLKRLIEHKAIPPRFTPAGGVPISATRPEQKRTPLQVSGQLEGDPSTWIDDQGVRIAADRARLFASRIEDVESLRVRERDESASLEEALADLPRLLGPKR
jgi:uncharacterized protein (TIGR02266 family)